MNFPPDENEPPAEISEMLPYDLTPVQKPKRPFFWLPAWAAVLVLVLLVLFTILEHGKEDRTPLAQDASELTDKMERAVEDTKVAFSERYGKDPIPYVSAAKKSAATTPVAPPQNPAPAHVISPAAADGPRGTARKRLPLHRPTTSKVVSSDSTSDEVVNEWQDLAKRKLSRASVWRRLGITLFLFDRPGGLDAFRHIKALQTPRPVKSDKRTALRTARKRAASASLELQPAEEVALWESIYGTGPINAADFGSLRAKLSSLNLGWFEHLALAQLCHKAGMPSLADQALGEARSAAVQVIQIRGLHVLLLLIGIVALIAYFFVFVSRRANSPQNYYMAAATAPAYPQGANDYFYAPPGVAPGRPIKVVRPPQPARADEDDDSPFSYRVRMISFVVYFGTFLFIAWPLRALYPLVANWSDAAITRLDLVIGLVLYIPVVVITLLAFKTLGEVERKQKFSWQETFAAVGLRSDGFLKDFGTALVGYAMTFPLILIAGILSNYLFKNFYTPAHPVDEIIMMTQNNVDKLLLFLQAAVGAPIVEELMFRGLLYKGLSLKWGAWGAAALSAAVFALSHNTLPGGFLTLWTLGFMFALVYRRNNSILPNIMMHAIHNALVTITMFAIFAR